MKRRVLLALGVVALAVLSARAKPAARVPRLLCASNSTGNYEIYLLDVETGAKGAKRLTNSEARSFAPAWSPDGKKIAFTSDRNGPPNIYVMDADGNNVRPLTREKDQCRNPAWSPDGKRIAFIRHVDNTNPEIFVMNADGNNPVNLTQSSAFDGDPAWSPDGKRIAFTSDRAGMGFRLYVMDADGANVKEISSTNNGFGCVYPAWSPNGKHIAYAEPVGNDLEIFVCEPDGKNKRQLTKMGGRNSFAAWSPHGKQLAFQHLGPTDPTSTLYLMDADGDNLKEISIATGPLDAGRPAWEPR